MGHDWWQRIQRKIGRVPISLADVPAVLLQTYAAWERKPGVSTRDALLQVAHNLAKDPAYYEKLKRMFKVNPARSRRQQQFMCAEYGRSKRGQKTRTSMKKNTLKEFCMRRKKNPHLRSGKWQFVGMFEKSDIGSVKRILRIHGIKAKVTKDHHKGERGMRELYVEKGKFDVSYRAISRLFEVGRAA